MYHHHECVLEFLCVPCHHCVPYLVQVYYSDLHIILMLSEQYHPPPLVIFLLPFTAAAVAIIVVFVLLLLLSFSCCWVVSYFFMFVVYFVLEKALDKRNCRTCFCLIILSLDSWPITAPAFVHTTTNCKKRFERWMDWFKNFFVLHTVDSVTLILFKFKWRCKDHHGDFLYFSFHFLNSKKYKRIVSHHTLTVLERKILTIDLHVCRTSLD